MAEGSGDKVITSKQVTLYTCDECKHPYDIKSILTIKGSIWCTGKTVDFNGEICWACLGKKFGADWVMNQEDYISLKCRAEL
jgi:hypothetical protein